MRNNKEVRAHHCLNTLKSLKKRDVEPLTRIEKNEDVIQPSTQFTNGRLNAMWIRMSLKYDKPTLLNSIDKTNLITIATNRFTLIE